MDELWKLPKEICIHDEPYRIRTDYRAILDILKAAADPELTDQEKNIVMLEILYMNPEEIPPEHLEEALIKGKEFIDCGVREEGKEKVRLMDWEQDSPIIASAINKTVGKDVRSLKYMHWWTFMSAYMEIGDGLFHQVIMIRQKKAKKKKLEKWELEFYRKNRSLVDLDQKKQERSAEEKEALKTLFGQEKR